MSVEWFDLGQRLRSAASGGLVPRLVHAPVLRAAKPVAVRAGQHRGVVQVSVAAPGRGVAAGEGDAALAVLAGYGVSLDEDEPVTLVIDDPGTLRHLLALARSVPAGSVMDATAALIGWWADRADFPGGGAVVDVVAACRARWVSGHSPKREREAGLWRGLLGVSDASAAGVLDLYDRCQLVSRCRGWLTSVWTTRSATTWRARLTATGGTGVGPIRPAGQLAAAGPL